MSMALTLARRGLGNVYPNPAVGCVIINAGTVVGRGWTMTGGRPHAEAVALENAGDAARGSVAYVTLEPCCHNGVTGPCTAALIRAGVKKVVISAQDPDCRVSGKGVQALQDAGIEVTCGVLQSEAETLNAGFFNSKLLNRPLVTVKLATTLDGKISLNKAGNQWITNSFTRRWVHKQRAMNDAIMVGSNTVVKDDPMLDCRLPGLERNSPIRVVIDRTGKLQDQHRLVRTASIIPTYVLTDNNRHTRLSHVQYLEVAGGPDFLRNSMQVLTQRLGITRLFVEGGGILVTELLKQELVDRFIWSRANKISGAGGADSIVDVGLLLGARCEFVKTQSLSFMTDTVDIFNVTYCPQRAETYSLAAGGYSTAEVSCSYAEKDRDLG